MKMKRSSKNILKKDLLMIANESASFDFEDQNSFDFDYDFILCESCPQEDLSEDAKEFQLSILCDFLDNKVDTGQFDFLDQKLKNLNLSKLPPYIFLGIAAYVSTVSLLKEKDDFIFRARGEFGRLVGQDKVADFDALLKEINKEMYFDDFMDNFESN